MTALVSAKQTESLASSMSQDETANVDSLLVAPPYVKSVNSDALNLLHILSAEAQDLRCILASINKGVAPLERYTAYIRLTCSQMSSLVKRLQGSDHICHIRNCWEQIETCPLISGCADQTIDAHKQTELLNILDEKCRRIVYWAGYYTIPDRLRHMLVNTTPGYTIPFHAVFEDEIPDADDRQKILNFLAWLPKDLKGGWVDAENGLVYRYEENHRKQLVSFLLMGLTLAGATATLFGISYSPPMGSTINISTLLLGWGAVLIGTLVHIGIAVAKHLRMRGVNPGSLPVSIFPIVVNAKLGQLLLKIFMTLIGYSALVYATRQSIQRDLDTFLLNAFLVGYSLDSVVELLGVSMDQRAAMQQTTLRNLLAIKG